jgi:hypothetical protein
MIDLLGVGMYVVVDYKYNVAVQVWHVVQVIVESDEKYKL